MDPLAVQKSCELHVHCGGCLTVDDILELARDVYREVDWSLYVESYAKAFGEKPNPVDIVGKALTGDPMAVASFKNHYLVNDSDAGDFNRFQAKFNLIICIYRHYARTLNREPYIQKWCNDRMVEQHRRQGISYGEYRCLFGRCAPDESPDEFIAYHKHNAQCLLDASDENFTACYIPSLDRKHALPSYNLLRQLLLESPELLDTIVGLDFCFVEEGHPPKDLKRFFQILAIDNARRKSESLEVVYHVGESFFDKSMESAVRWCHEAAIYGAKRLGHAIALGMDPAVAIARKPDAHEAEKVSERLDQIAYDLQFKDDLERYGVIVKESALKREKRQLEKQNPDEIIFMPYDDDRLEQIRCRQDYVLADLAEMGTVIECCPTSNLRIGGVPTAEDHPIHRFLDSNVNLVIAADDPGIFDTTLADELQWVCDHTKYSPEQLAKRLGDPMQYRLGAKRKS